MKHFIQSILFLFLFNLVFFSSANAQDGRSKKLLKADLAFEAEQYFSASELYKKAYAKTKNKALKAEIIFKQAECFRLSLNTKRAESYYKRAIKAKYPNVEIYLIYADMLRLDGDYSGAKEQYKEYLKLNPTDVNGELGLKSCEYSVKWLDKPTRYQVELMSVLNSRSNDYSVAFGKGDYSELFFTSSRDGGISDKIDARTGENFSDIYFSKLNKKDKWSAPALLQEPVNTEGHEGSVFINNRGTVMFFTQCLVEKNESTDCGIYVAKRKGKIWGKPMLLQVRLDSNVSFGHPAVSEDESIVIFSSDMSGGYGGKDLWMVRKEERGRWSLPVNLGPAINTPKDEMFPFIRDDKTIYFSSNGHVGMGGLDVFKSTKDELGLFSSVVNMKYPMNSSADDFSVIIEKDFERGYITSNRDGGKGGDDIYQFELPPLEFSLKGIVMDSKTGGIMTGIKVQLIGNDGITNEVVTDNTGVYEFDLKPLTSYEIIVNTEGYLNRSINETTVGVENNKVFVIDFSVDPVKKEVILPRIEYDFNEFNLRPQSIADLDILAETLKDNLNVVIQLKSHTDYIGSDAQNYKLSQQRADVCVAYLISQGIDAGQLVAKGIGENEPFVIEKKDGRLKEGDVLTEKYIKKIKFKKNKEKANQYNRRTSFKVLREDYVPATDKKK
jgi:peptidoglycan-associated lipoprotein